MKKLAILIAWVFLAAGAAAQERGTAEQQAVAARPVFEGLQAGSNAPAVKAARGSTAAAPGYGSQTVNRRQVQKPIPAPTKGQPRKQGRGRGVFGACMVALMGLAMLLSACAPKGDPCGISSNAIYESINAAGLASNAVELVSRAVDDIETTQQDGPSSYSATVSINEAREYAAGAQVKVTRASKVAGDCGKDAVSLVGDAQGLLDESGKAVDAADEALTIATTPTLVSLGGQYTVANPDGSTTTVDAPNTYRYDHAPEARPALNEAKSVSEEITRIARMLEVDVPNNISSGTRGRSRYTPPAQK